MNTRAKAIAAAVCAIATVAVGALIFIAKNKSSIAEQTEGMANPEYGDRRVTEPMPSFSERPLSLPPSNVVGSYTPPAAGEPEPEPKPQ